KRRKNLKIIVAIAVALAFILPSSAAFVNVGTIGVTSDSEVTSDIENIVETSTNSDTTGDTIDTEESNTVITTEYDIEVDDDNPDPNWYDATHVKTITEGIANASGGDTVYVYNGTYYECVTITKQLDLVG
ncbi:unnamed protein product, partial [marine sediment metagenome]